MKLILSFLFAFLFLTASAQSTHRQYLSGEGLNHTVTVSYTHLTLPTKLEV